MKIATLFSHGSYGTFISWCIYSFSELNNFDDVISPISKFGSSHKFRGKQGFDIVTPTHDPLDESYINYVLVECDKEKMINYIDNQFQKQSLGDLEAHVNTFFPNANDKLKEHWSGSNRWELRELLSFFLEDMIISIKNQIDKNHLQVKFNNCCTICPETFLLNPTKELEKIFLFFNLKKHKEFETADTYVSEYVKQQQNFIKHQQINEFVKNSIDNIPYSVPNLTIFDEAYIQYKLRLQGYEIKCYDLNKVLSNSSDLVGLLERRPSHD
jgi:hypothetical protein